MIFVYVVKLILFVYILEVIYVRKIFLNFYNVIYYCVILFFVLDLRDLLFVE